MKINIHSDKTKVTEAIKKHIITKLKKLDKYFENASDLTARVVIKIKDRAQTIEVTIPTARVTLRNEETNVDLYAAVDLIVDKLERQIRKNKTKIQTHVLAQKSDFKFDDIEEDEEDSKIAVRKLFDMKPMSEAEAILQMNMLNYDFFIFKDADNSDVCVLYKRKDGQYGLIKTK